MAKVKKKIPWNDIKRDYEMGMSQAEIRKKYDVSSGAIGNKIRRDKWKLSQEQQSALSDFSNSSVRVSQEFVKASESQQKEMVAELNTILEDNELIVNNRKLLKLAQGIIVKKKDNFCEKTIRNLTGAIRDIEAVANPQASVRKEEKKETDNGYLDKMIEALKD